MSEMDGLDDGTTPVIGPQRLRERYIGKKIADFIFFMGILGFSVPVTLVLIPSLESPIPPIAWAVGCGVLMAIGLILSGCYYWSVNTSGDRDV